MLLSPWLDYYSSFDFLTSIDFDRNDSGSFDD